MGQGLYGVDAFLVLFVIADGPCEVDRFQQEDPGTIISAIRKKGLIESKTWISADGQPISHSTIQASQLCANLLVRMPRGVA